MVGGKLTPGYHGVLDSFESESKDEDTSEVKSVKNHVKKLTYKL